MIQPEILFLFPRCSGSRTFDGFDYHLGAGYIRAFLSDRGISSAQFVHDGSASLEETCRLITDFDSRIIGVSCYDVSYPLVKLLATSIKKRCPNVLLLCGGPSATFSDSVILKDCPAIDLCVRGYAEDTTTLIAEQGGDLKKVDGIPGISFRHGEEIVRVGDVRPLQASIDRYPDPYLEGIIPPERAADIGIVTSRGCTFPCSFCNCSAMSGRRVAFHSLERVKAVIEFLDANLRAIAGIKRRVAIVDDNFSIEHERFMSLLRWLKQKSFRDMEFWAEMRTENLSDGTYEDLAAAGFKNIHFGLESAVPHVLASLSKVRSSGWEKDDYARERDHIGRIERAVEGARREGISVSISVILGAPGESHDDGQRTLDMVKNLDVDSYAHNYLRILPGTALAKSENMSGVRKKVNPGKPLPWSTEYAYDVYGLPILDNDNAHFGGNAEHVRDMLKMLSGVSFNVVSRNDPGPMDGAGRKTVLVDNDTCLESDFLGFARELDMSASVWLKHREAIDTSDLSARMLDAGIAVHDLNTVRIAERCGEEQWRINELLRTAPDENTMILGFSDMVSEITSIGQGVPGRFLALRRVSSLAGVELLAGMASDFRESGEMPVARLVRECGTCLVDECRWGSHPCPAATAGRLFVDSTGVRPCLSGKGVLRSVDSPGSWKKTMMELREKTLERRGCNDCPVCNTCSKCMITAPLSESEYCAIRRENPWIHPVPDALGVFRTAVLLQNAMKSIGDFRIQRFSGAEATTLRWGRQARDLSEGMALVDGEIPLCLFFPGCSEILALSPMERVCFGALLG